MTTERQHWDPERYQRNAGFVAELGLPVVDLLAPMAGERILDLGCGDGRLTERLAAMGCIVTGMDASAEQIEAAVARGLDARVGDGQQLDFENEFDAVFSNAAIHWMPDQAAVVDGAWRALRPGGRFVGEFGGGDNTRTVRGTLHAAMRRRGLDPEALDPWTFPSDAEFGAMLEARGFRVRFIALIPRPTPLPGDIGGWIETFCESFLTALDPADRPRFLEELREDLAPKLRQPDGSWSVDYVRLRFAADRP